MAVFTCNTVFNNRRHHSHLHSLYINAGLNLWASALIQLLIWSTVPFIDHHNGPSAHIPPPAFSSVRKITYLWRHVISSYLHQTQNFSVQSLFLLFGSSILNILSPPIYLLSLLWTCLNYLSLAFLNFLSKLLNLPNLVVTISENLTRCHWLVLSAGVHYHLVNILLHFLLYFCHKSPLTFFSTYSIQSTLFIALND